MISLFPGFVRLSTTSKWIPERARAGTRPQFPAVPCGPDQWAGPGTVSGLDRSFGVAAPALASGADTTAPRASTAASPRRAYLTRIACFLSVGRALWTARVGPLTGGDDPIQFPRTPPPDEASAVGSCVAGAGLSTAATAQEVLDRALRLVAQHREREPVARVADGVVPGEVAPPVQLLLRVARRLRELHREALDVVVDCGVELGR